jgi:hypothetical protein
MQQSEYLSEFATIRKKDSTRKSLTQVEVNDEKAEGSKIS